jgi:hypothetical protein
MEHEGRLKTVTPAEDREAERSEAERAGAGVTGRPVELSPDSMPSMKYYL